MAKPVNSNSWLEQSVPATQLESSRGYTNMLQGKATNAISKASNRRATVDPFTGVGEIMTADNVKVFISNSTKLNPIANRVLDLITQELTANFPYGKEATAEDIDRHRAVMLSVDDYMTKRKLKDKKEARKQLRESMQAIYNLSLDWTETRYIKPEGKKRTKKEEIHYKARVIDFMAQELEKNPVQNGRVYAKFTMDIAKYLSQAFIMPYPDKLMIINDNANPHSYHIGRRLAEHYNMNIGKNTANRISVKTLIEALPDLPSYEEIMNDARQISKRIIEPFERDITALVEKYGILESWNYCKSKGEPLTDKEKQNYSYETWVQWQIEFRLASYPDQSERLAKREEKIQRAIEAKAKREKKRKEKNDKADKEKNPES